MRLAPSSAVALALVTMLMHACGGGSAADRGSSGGARNMTAGASGTGAAVGMDAATGAGGSSNLVDLTNLSCIGNGNSCGDGGVCAGGKCCVGAPACGDVCCQDGQVCSFNQCVTPGAACADSSDCAATDYCELSLSSSGSTTAGGTGCSGGGVTGNGQCLPRPPICGSGQMPGDPPACLQSCQVVPSSFAFSLPELKYSWGGSSGQKNVMMTPLVIELDDDDCDGRVTERDIPEIVFSTYSSSYQAAGILHAISIVGGNVVEKWSVPSVLNATKQLAAGDIDATPGNEIVGCGADGAVHAFSSDGKPLWTSPAMTCYMPSIADLDQDGMAEVIVEGAILDGKTGTIKHKYSAVLSSPPIVSDIDADGKLDVVTSSQGFDAQGVLFVDTGLVTATYASGTSDWTGPWPAVADFDGDGKPEIVAVDNVNHAVSAWRFDASQPAKFSVVRAPIDINGTLIPCKTGWGSKHGGGPPTIADFNGDGTPDVALAGGAGYSVFDGKKFIDSNVLGIDTFLWAQPTTDCSSAGTGSTVFDFNGDGRAEVAYSDEHKLRIYDGPTGTVLWETCNTTWTLMENPVVADVDNDGHADIVVVSNDHTSCNDNGTNTVQAGVRVFGDPNGNWVRTRRVWNEHAYHVTNVNEDGSIPQVESPNYTSAGLNNFRQQKQPGGEFSAPDAVVRMTTACLNGFEAVVTNVGEAALPSGVVVGFYAGSPPTGTFIGSATTTRSLYPAESESVVLAVSVLPQGVTLGDPVYAVVDDGTNPHPQWVECRVDNNTSAPVRPDCSGVR